MKAWRKIMPDQARRRRERDRVNHARCRARAAGRDPDKIPEPQADRCGGWCCPYLAPRRPAGKTGPPADLAAGMVRRRIR